MPLSYDFRRRFPASVASASRSARKRHKLDGDVRLIGFRNEVWTYRVYRIKSVPRSQRQNPCLIVQRVRSRHRMDAARTENGMELVQSRTMAHGYAKMQVIRPRDAACRFRRRGVRYVQASFAVDDPGSPRQISRFRHWIVPVVGRPAGSTTSYPAASMTPARIL